MMRVHVDRARLAHELDQAEFRANRLEEVNREVSRRLAEQNRKAEAERAKRVAGVRPSSGAPSNKPRALNLDSALEQSFSQLGL